MDDSLTQQSSSLQVWYCNSWNSHEDLVWIWALCLIQKKERKLLF